MRKGFVPTARLGGYSEYAPPPTLRGSIDALWIHRAMMQPVHEDHTVIPDPRVSLTYHRQRQGNGQSAPGSLAIIGPVTKARRFPLRAGREIVAVRIRLEAAIDILGTAPADHLNAIDSIDHVAEFRGLSDRLAGLSGSAQILETLLNWVARRIQRLDGPTYMNGKHKLLAATAQIQRKDAGRKITEIAESCGLSVRHLRRLARSLLGLGPKELSRLLRVERAILAADRSDRPRWADIAVAAGFADQAHLVRDCKELTGRTPRSLYLHRRRESVAHDLAISGALTASRPAGGERHVSKLWEGTYVS